MFRFRLLWLLLLGLLVPSFALAQVTSNNIIRLYDNDTTTGTTQYLLAKIVTGTGGKGKAILAATTDTSIKLYVVISASSTSGKASVIMVGEAQCVMDATNASGMAGKPVVASTTTAGRCHVQTNPPANGMVVGTLNDDATTSGQTASIDVLNQAYIPGSGAGTGTVTSAALSLPTEFSVAGSPITTAGTFTVTKANQTANCVFAGPTTGSPGAWACRALVAADLPAGTAIGSCGGDLGGTFPNCTVVQASGAFALPGDLRPTTLTGSVNDYNPTGLSTATGLYVDGGTSDRDVTGLAGGADGRVMPFCNRGATNNLTMRNQSASSSAANRFAFVADVTLLPDACALLQYDSTAQRWRRVNGAVSDPIAVRVCELDIGSASVNAPPLADDEDSTTSCGNAYGRDWKITAFACKANAGSPTVTPILTGGNATSIVTGAVTCTTSWTTGTINGTPTLRSFSSDGATCSSTPCTVDANVTTAGGTATRIQMRFIGSIQK